MRNIYLIDCPGFVYPEENQSEAELVMKGVVRVEYLRTPEMYIDNVLARVRRDHIQNHYGIAKWESSEDFLEQLSRRSGKLLKGGEADVKCVAKMMLNDFQRGKLPYCVIPEGFEVQESFEMALPLAKVPEDVIVGGVVEDGETALFGVTEDDVNIVNADLLDANDKISDEISILPDENMPEQLVSNEAEINTNISDPAESKRKSLPLPDFISFTIPKPKGKFDSAGFSIVDKDMVNKRKRKLDNKANDVGKDVEIKLTSKEKRRLEREQMPKKIGVHFYQWANVKNKSLAKKFSDSLSSKSPTIVDDKKNKKRRR